MTERGRARQLRGAALAKLGDIRSRQGRHDEAARLHGEAASVWWQAEPLKGFALMAWMQQATDLFRLAQFDEALETIEHIIAIDDGFPDFVQLPSMLTAGLSMWLFLVEETRDYERLYKAGEAAISRIQSVDTPQSREVLARALTAKATAEHAFGKYEDALRLFEEAIDQCSVHELALSEPLSRAMLRRAALLDECGDSQQASAAYGDLLNRFASVPDEWAQDAVATAKEWLAAAPG